MTTLGARALLIVDEAQKLPVNVLEQIKKLSRLAEDTPFQIVLVGQLGLSDRLRIRDLRQLDHRVAIRYRLRPLLASETAAYVQHRLTVAAEEPSVRFTPRALQRVHRATGGNPRLINLLCDRAMLAGYSAQDAESNRQPSTAPPRGFAWSQLAGWPTRCSAGCAAASPRCKKEFDVRPSSVAVFRPQTVKFKL